MGSELDTARKLIELVGGRAEAEAIVASGRAALTRFANSFIHQNVGEDYVFVSLRLAVDGRVARGSSNRTDDEGLLALVEGTIEAARLSPVDDVWPGVAEPVQPPEADNFDEDTAEASPQQRSAIVGSFVEAGPGMDAAGYCDTHAAREAFANSRGQQVAGRSTRATLDGIQQVEGSAGSAHRTSVRLGDLDGATAGSLAAERARRGVGAADLAPGEYQVVLGPEAVATIGIFLSFYGFNGKQVNEGQSFLELGVQQFDERISLWDDVGEPGGLGVPFDAEGTPRHRLDLITDGVTVGVAHDRRTAAESGVVSTGHAIIGGETSGPVASALVLENGDEDVEGLIGHVDQGLYVATFNYCRILDPKTQVVTGLTRNGTFMIRGGELAEAVSNLRFTQSFVEALGPGRVLGVGDDRRFADCEFGPGIVRAPTLRLGCWNFTGGAEG
jgi:predicted Zn-dependent protease